MEVVAEPYVKWQSPDTKEEEEEDVVVKPLVERKTKHSIATSFDSEGGESFVSEISQTEEWKVKTSSSDEAEDILKDPIHDELPVSDVGLSAQNVYFDNASGFPNGTSGVESRTTYTSVYKDGSVTQSSEVTEDSVTTTTQGGRTITTTQHKTTTDIETEPVYHSSHIQHPVLNSAVNGHGHVHFGNQNGREYHIRKDSGELGDLLEDDPEPIDYNVDELLKKQETHELICPNCNKCITRSIILRKRIRVKRPKAVGPTIGSAPTRGVGSGIGSDPNILPGTGVALPPITIDPSRVDPNDVITCWSCFSLLIPSGTGLAILGWGSKKPNPSNQTPDSTVRTEEPGSSHTLDLNPNPALTVPGSKLPINPPTIEKGPITVTPSPGEVSIFIPEGAKQGDQAGLQNVPVISGAGTQAPVRPTIAPVRQARDWDILKSIVYGGLIESITSLGIVSSAAGAETATMNVLALGLANLIGGLILVFHNLKDLKKSATEGPSNQVDRYYETLGRRNHITRHAIIVVLSFIIFGLIPVVTYAFTFRTSDNRDYKSLAVIGASLVCIAVLSLGKAHTKNSERTTRSYFNSMTYYLSIAISASGLSYIAGKLLQELIEKTGWFDTTSSVSSIFPNTINPSHSHPAWSSY